MYFDDKKKLSLEEIKEIELNLLSEFDCFCNKHSLKYTLDGGTLLGAVRHQGFIPWDDDIDVSMPLPDFLKFVELYRKENKDLSRDLLYGTDDSYGFHYGKLVDKRTIVKSGFREDKRLYSVWIDIFPMYSIDDDDNTASVKHKKILKYYEKTWMCLCTRFRNPLRKVYHLLFNDVMLKYYIKKINSIIFENTYGTTKRIEMIPVVYKKLLPTNNDHFENRILLDFEGKKFYVPKEFDHYLSVLYGNYMELPPENQRRTHSVEAYWVNK